MMSNHPSVTSIIHNELCSDRTDETKKMYLNSSSDAYRECCPPKTSIIHNEFAH